MFVILCLPSILNKAVLDPLSPEIGIHLSEGKAFSISEAINFCLVQLYCYIVASLLSHFKHITLEEHSCGILPHCDLTGGNQTITKECTA